MSDLNKEYIDLRDGDKVYVDNLSEFLKEHPDIERVILFWTVQCDFYTSHASKFSAYVTETMLDEEYSFDGSRAKAAEYASNYDQWDGHDMLLLLDGRLLYGYYADYDNQTSWNDGYDHVSGIHRGIDPSWISFIWVFDDDLTKTEYLLSPDPYPSYQRGESE